MYDPENIKTEAQAWSKILCNAMHKWEGQGNLNLTGPAKCQVDDEELEWEMGTRMEKKEIEI